MQYQAKERALYQDVAVKICKNKLPSYSGEKNLNPSITQYYAFSAAATEAHSG